MSTSLVQDFAASHGQEVDVERVPYDVLLRIIDAIHPNTGLKENDGNLKKSYPDKFKLFHNENDLLYDAATLSHAACYCMTCYGGRDGFRQAVMNVDAIIEAVKALPHEKSGEAFNKLSWHVLEQRDKEDGRQTDFDDAYNWHVRTDLVRQYIAMHGSIKPTQPSKQIELIAG